MNDAKTKKQIVDKIKDSANVLVALSADPSVDELSAALGVTLAINKIDKHATAVFSGNIPAAIEFLEPEKTFENSVASLQDFIIALDKEKADHLRYKVEGDMVKIFITPYRTTIDEHDLEFSQGDFNVDFVLAIGVKTKDDLDAALKSHGQILDDATVASIELDGEVGLGSVNWGDKNASSYCEMAASLVKDLKTDGSLLDEQIATALLTGIVAATDRFSNARTSSRVMTTAADLMAAGANQQLIAVQLKSADEISDTEVEQPAKAEPTEQVPESVGGNGELAISHQYAGDVDEVAEQVQEKSQDEAAQAAEDELAEQLGAAGQPANAAIPPVAEVPAYEETPLKGAMAAEHWQTPPAEPVLGGTLNATTEEAADAKRREEEDTQNHTILSHDSSGYITNQPAYQAPMSAATGGATDEPEVADIFDESPTAHAEAVDAGLDASASTLPPAQVQPSDTAGVPVVDSSSSTLPPAGPTLADIDAANRASAPQNGPGTQLPPVNPLSTLPPGLPPLPPMPDFSTLPPLPGAQPPVDAQASLPSDQSTIPPAPLGSTLPPATASEPGKADPSQFKIPGQQ